MVFPLFVSKICAGERTIWKIFTFIVVRDGKYPDFVMVVLFDKKFQVVKIRSIYLGIEFLR